MLIPVNRHVSSYVCVCVMSMWLSSYNIRIPTMSPWLDLIRIPSQHAVLYGKYLKPTPKADAIFGQWNLADGIVC